MRVPKGKEPWRTLNRAIQNPKKGSIRFLVAPAARTTLREGHAVPLTSVGKDQDGGGKPRNPQAPPTPQALNQTRNLLARGVCSSFGRFLLLQRGSLKLFEGGPDFQNYIRRNRTAGFFVQVFPENQGKQVWGYPMFDNHSHFLPFALQLGHHFQHRSCGHHPQRTAHLAAREARARDVDAR